ncbi:DMT family transporter [Candidatus Endowatersipora endosymbiont of Watersipora subatra]|uniref:DMT family transporter n=1 Tax=Candidatus Endowatersipora endosymbiont of Watersipora subatra TaxID=3077946 RepID=UPI00312C8D7D
MNSYEVKRLKRWIYEPMNLDHTTTPLGVWRLLVLAYLMFSLLDVAGKYLVLAGFMPLFVVWSRFAGHTIFIMFMLKFWNNPGLYHTRKPLKQFIRGAMLTFTALSNFIALRYLQLSETVAIFLASPMIITALSGPMLGEWAGWRHWIAVIIGFFGVIIVVRPGTTMFQWPVLFSIFSVVTYSLYAIMTRKMTETETDESMIFYSGLIPTCVLFPILFFQQFRTVTINELFAFCIMGVFGSVGHLMLVKAHRLAPAPLIAPAVFTSIIWMILLGYLIFNQLPDSWTVLGASIIIASGFYLLQREHFLKN